MHFYCGFNVQRIFRKGLVAMQFDSMPTCLLYNNKTVDPATLFRKSGPESIFFGNISGTNNQKFLKFCMFMQSQMCIFVYVFDLKKERFWIRLVQKNVNGLIQKPSIAVFEYQSPFRIAVSSFTIVFLCSSSPYLFAYRSKTNACIRPSNVMVWKWIGCVLNWIWTI